MSNMIYIYTALDEEPADITDILGNIMGTAEDIEAEEDRLIEFVKGLLQAKIDKAQLSGRLGSSWVPPSFGPCR
jgi:hypothetical protein